MSDSAVDTDQDEANRQLKVPLLLIVGSGGISFPGWLSTDIDVLDILKESDWLDLIGDRRVDAILSEHVLEHIAVTDQLRSLELCYRFLRPGGLLRVAVPDGLRPDPAYRCEISPPRDGHTMTFTYRSLEAIMRQAGFETTLLEHFDEKGCFCFRPWNEKQGLVRRSARFDTQTAFRMQAGEWTLNYTSIIIDGVKPLRS